MRFARGGHAGHHDAYRGEGQVHHAGEVPTRGGDFQLDEFSVRLREPLQVFGRNLYIAENDSFSSPGLHALDHSLGIFHPACLNACISFLYLDESGGRVLSGLTATCPS